MGNSKLLKFNKIIEAGVVGGYKKIEENVVGGFTKVSDKFVDSFLTHEGETVDEAKKRLAKEEAVRESNAFMIDNKYRKNYERRD